MTSADLPRRVERTEEDLTAVSDVVLEIKETVDQHTGALAQLQTAVARVDSRLDTVNSRLDTLESRVNDGFAEILRRLDAR